VVGVADGADEGGSAGGADCSIAGRMLGTPRLLPAAICDEEGESAAGDWQAPINRAIAATPRRVPIAGWRSWTVVVR